MDKGRTITLGKLIKDNMGLLIKRFNNNSEYETFTGTSEFIVPNVSYTLNEHDVHYNPCVDPSGGHEYVEIGGLKWATMNIGANSVTDYGQYFQWGDTQGYTYEQVGSGEGKKYFGCEDYKYYNDGSYTKYNSEDGFIILQTTDDAARTNWGGAWRMPTTEEFQALGNATTSAWTNDYQGTGVAGLVCTDKTDSSKALFFPAAGYLTTGSPGGPGTYGCYSSSSLYTSDVQRVYNLGFVSGYVSWQGNVSRCGGYTVRPVMDA